MTSSDVLYLPPPDASPWLSQAASLVLHAGVIALLALLVPPPAADGETAAEDVEWIRHVLASTGSGEDDGFAGDSTPLAPRLASQGGGNVRAIGSQDVARDSRSPLLAQRGGGPGGRSLSTDENSPVARQEAAVFGMIGLLADPPGGDPNLPPSPWARSETNGASSGGALWGDAIGDGFGIGGVGLSGIGEGSGGRGEGILIGGIGTMGHGLGDGVGEGFGVCGCGHGRLGGSHLTRAPSIRCGPPPDAPPGTPSGCTATVQGRLPPEAVQRVVRQSFGRFRLCYEEGLRTDPALEGRVSVKFVIDRQGGVAMAADAGSDLRDESVVACVVRGFQALSFPEPEGGIVTVIYPLVLSPSERR